MKKFFFVLLVFVCLHNSLSAQTEELSDEEISDKGFFILYGVLYNYEKIESDPVWTINGMNGVLGTGYDFGKISINLTLGYMLLSLIECQYYTASGEHTIESGYNFSIMLNMGIKIIDGAILDLTFPMGIMANVSQYTLKNANIAKDFLYTYLNIESGLVLSLRCFKHIYLEIPFNIGYPVYKVSEISNYPKHEYTPFNYSIGIAIKRTF